MDAKYLDPHFGIPNINLYNENVIKLGYDKLCMTEIVNADAAIASQGIDVYYMGCNEVLKGVQQTLEAYGLSEVIHLYTLNYKNFILVANESLARREFIHIIKGFYEQFENTTADSTPISGVSRFALVLQSDRMVERALNTFYLNKDKQENFLFSRKEFVYSTEMEEHSNIIEILTKAINENQVVPYYQGIHNNEKGKIDRYEALMRIVDSEGHVYFPDAFLPVAKQYKFYNRISKMMIGNVLDTFRGREESISINISLYDLQTVDFRKWLLEEVKKFINPERIIVEFVETEHFIEEEIYLAFMDELRAVGCKVAVDDFGAGYASYTRIIALKPDYIKIDGSIIKDITRKDENMKVFQSICFLADLVGAKVVAEFVEDEDVQRLLMRYEIPYSQGYYFAKPIPIEGIE